MTGPHVDQAVAALAGKAQRLRASAASQPRDVARKRELADGLDRLASLAAHGPLEVRRLLDLPTGQGMRADALLELAEAIHPGPFWTWTRAGLLLRLGRYTAAAEPYGSAGGACARHAPAMVAQCQAKAVSTHDPVAEHARHLEAQIARCEANCVDPAPLIEVQSQPGELLAPAMLRLQPAPDATPGREPPMANDPGGSCVFSSTRPVIGLWCSSLARAILAVVADHLMEGRKNRCPLFRSGWQSDLLAR